MALLIILPMMYMLLKQSLATWTSWYREVELNICWIRKPIYYFINSLVQNFAARVVLGLKKFDHISRGRKSLKWLDVTEKVLP